MDIWETYNSRLTIDGETRREISINREKDRILRRLTASASYKKNIPIDGVEQNVCITDEEAYNIKGINAMPGDKLKHGGIVEWEENHWLITEVDAHSEIYEKGLMQQCNHILRWRDESGAIVEKWCIVEDGTKYLVGEQSSKIMTTGDARISITIPKDSDTVKLKRGRRFLIDDPDTNNVLAYQITKPNRLFNVFNNNGVFRFILSEVNITDNDNLELRVADYTAPTMNTDTDSHPDVIDTNDKKKGWI